MEHAQRERLFRVFSMAKIFLILILMEHAQRVAYVGASDQTATALS